MEKFTVLVATVVYTYLRLIVDHIGQKFAALRQREIEFCVSLLRERVSGELIIVSVILIFLLSVLDY